ncbi:iron chelate uptake ABC transporter family permease subunit [uncultured Sphaerochaeta sp.]|uniref:metal ABC transporter permease n=1 Tax=uncultured Sphaerochaeta sp. TaxID=886478 RepID=UPI002608B744|nr:iron chelate uptake ABC transporter family permease subunit [uncultured Sphaerochaeta sp.]
MHDFLFALSLPPVARGLFAMAIAGLCFPASGVMVLRLNLVPMRYMLMHGVILGGAISLAFTLPVLPTSILLNVLLVLFMLLLKGDSSHGFGLASAAAMVFSMALASLVMHLWDVPAKDTLQLLWGSPFALSTIDIATLIAIAVVLLLYLVLNFRTISAMFFDQEIAQSLGMAVKLHHTLMVLIIALVIAFAMKLLGALLIDALLILPVMVGSKRATSLKQLLWYSCLTGLFISTFGYLLAVATDLPPSAAIALLSALLYLIPTSRKKGKTV